MAEKVDEIAALLERLKIENDLNSSEFNSVLLDIKSKLENMDTDSVEVNSIVTNLREVLNSKISTDEQVFVNLADKLKQLRALLENTVTSADYANLSGEVQTLSGNFREAVDAIVTFANKDTESKNILFDKVSALETAVNNNEIIDVVKQRSEDLISSFEHYTADSNLRHGNIISAMADLKQVIDENSNKNAYLINSLENIISANTEKISTLDGTVSAQLGTVNSKLFALSDDIHKTLEDGLERLKYLSTSLSDYMNGNSIDMKTSFECLRANLSDYSEQLKVQMDDFTNAFDQKFADGSNIQTRNTQAIVDELNAFSAKIDEKAREYEDSITDKTSKIYEILTAYKDAVAGLEEDSKGFFDSKFAEVETNINETCLEYKTMLEDIRSKFDEYSSSMTEMVDSAVLGVVNSNSESINSLKGDLLASAASNLDKIINKIDSTTESISGFKESVADSLSEYLSAIKDLFVDYSNRMDSSLRDDEIVEKLSHVEELIKASDDGRNSNFELVKAKFDESGEILRGVSDKLNAQSEDFANRLNESGEILKGVSDKLNAQSEDFANRLNESGEMLRDVSDKLNAQSEDFANRLNESGEILKGVSDKLNAQGVDFANNFGELKILVADSSAKDEILDKLTSLINEKSSNKDEQLGELKKIIEDYHVRIDDVVNQGKYSNNEFIVKLDDLKNVIIQATDTHEIFEKFFDLINAQSDEKNEKLDDLRNIIMEYKSSVEQLADGINVQRGNVLSELAEIKANSGAAIPKLDALQNIEQVLSDNAETYRVNLNKGLEEVQASVSEIINSVRELNSNDDSELVSKLSSIEMQLSDSTKIYEQNIDSLRVSVNEYIAGTDKIYSETSAKLDVSIENVQKIQENFVEISSKMSTLIGDSGLIEILANIRQQFNPILQALQEEKENLNNTLNDGVNSISSNLYLIGQNLEEVRVKQSENAEYLRSNFEEKMLGLQADIEHTISDIKGIIEAKFEAYNANYEALKESVDKFASFDYGQAVLEIKDKIEISYLGLVGKLDEALKNSDVFSKVEEAYQNAVMKFESFERDIQELSKENAENFNKAILNVSAMLQNNYTLTENVQTFLETEFAKLDRELQENKISVKSSLVDLLEEIKNILGDKKTNEMEDLRSAILPLLDNEDTLNLIKSLNKGLADRLEECAKDNNLAFQDVLDVINSVKNTVEYTLDVINDKFSASEEDRKSINQKLDSLNSKFDIIAMDDSNSEILDSVSEISDSVEGVREAISEVKNVVVGINDNTLSNNTIIPAIENGVTSLKDAIDRAKDELKSGFAGADILNEINVKLDTMAACEDNSFEDDLFDIKNSILKLSENIGSNEDSAKLVELVKVLDNKLDVIALNDNSDLIEELQDVKDGVDLVKQELCDSQKINELIQVIDNKLDVIVQDNNSDLTADIVDIKEGLSSIKNEINLSEIENSINTINNKLDILADSSYDSEISEGVEYLRSVAGRLDEKLGNLDELKSDSSAIREKLGDFEQLKSDSSEMKEKLESIKSNTDSNPKLEELMNTLHSKVDVLADDSDIQAEITEIKDLIENQIASSNSNDVNESLQTLLNKISEIDLSKQAGEIKEAIISAVVSVSNGISFVEETEEIKDFVNEKTNELHRTMMDVKRQLSTLTCSGDDMDIYSYTLQDVESDLAKLRLILKDMSGESPNNEICVISNNISKISKSIEDLRVAFIDAETKRLNSADINEQIVSISSRLNQLILNKKEVDGVVVSSLEEARNKLELMDNTAITKGIEKVLVSMDEKLSYSTNLNTVLKNVMMYLGEWMDGTTETISSIYDKTSKISTLSDALIELRKVIPERQQLVDFIEARFAEQESKFDRLERQLEKLSNIVLSHNDSSTLDRMDSIDQKLENLSKNIEKLASYVE